MKVLQILPELNEGGVERGVVELNREFSLLGLDSLSMSKGGHLVSRIENEGGKHYEFDVCSKNIFSIPFRVGRLKRYLDEIDPQIIHARSRVPAWLAYLANKKTKRPFVTTVHGLNSVSPYSKVMTYGDRVICVSEVVKDYILKNYHVNEGKIRVIQRGVDMDYFDPGQIDNDKVKELKSTWNLTGRVVITSVGRVTYLKDYETFIKSIARIRKTHPEVSGVIVGGVHESKQDYKQSLVDLAKNEGVEDSIVFTGSQSDIRAYYAMSDIVVNASLKMGNMGRTVVEALAMGKPVLATTYPGLNNLVKNHVNGFVIPTQDVDKTSQCMLDLLNTPAKLLDIRSTVPQEYTLSHMVNSILMVYRELV